VLTDTIFSFSTVQCLLEARTIHQTSLFLEDKYVSYLPSSFVVASQHSISEELFVIFRFSFDLTSYVYLMLTVIMFRGCDEAMAGGTNDPATNVEIGQLYLALEDVTLTI